MEDSSECSINVPAPMESRRPSRNEDNELQIQVQPESEQLSEEQSVDQEQDGANIPKEKKELVLVDPKSRYFSCMNILCIVLSLLVSAYFIFEPHLITLFWKAVRPEETAEFVLNLKTCKIPNLYDGQSELPFMWDVDISRTNDLADVDFRCTHTEKLSSVINDKLELTSKTKKRKCCYRDVTRPPRMVADMYVVSSDCNEIFLNETDVSGNEFILVQCSNTKNKSVDFNTHAQLPIKPSVQEKLDYWNSTLNVPGHSVHTVDSKPFSVAVIVIGSTSKSHAYRSLPDTMSLLEMKSGFTVMNGYNIMEDWRIYLSFSNMIQLITGTLPPDENDWINFWDNDTKLFSDFENEKFVTMFMDDSRKLLRSSQEDPYDKDRYISFLEQPTDYYMKPFLETHKEATDALFMNSNTSKPYCFGKQTMTAYLLQHLTKFHKKFSSVPSFSFNYFSWPQAQHGLEALAKMDKTYYDFFKEFLKTPQLLETTAVVVMSDIGSLNHSYFNTEHGTLENLNPLLMIRLPDNLLAKNPSFKENLVANSHRLISPIDVHKTISIFSKIGVPKRPLSTEYIQRKIEERKERNITGRNLFISEIPHDRECSHAYIPDTLCLCGKDAPSQFHGRSIISKDGKPEKYWHYYHHDSS